MAATSKFWGTSGRGNRWNWISYDNQHASEYSLLVAAMHVYTFARWICYDVLLWYCLRLTSFFVLFLRLVFHLSQGFCELLDILSIFFSLVLKRAKVDFCYLLLRTLTYILSINNLFNHSSHELCFCYQVFEYFIKCKAKFRIMILYPNLFM